MKKEAVILLHGLGRTRFSLNKMASALRAHYQVINQGYPSRRYPIEKLAEQAIGKSLEQCPDAEKVHFVTHSMGGILVRQYLAQNTIENLGHTVMLGPPNQGSELVDFFMSKPLLSSLFKSINGPAGIQLNTSKIGKPANLGDANFKLGVIAGTKNYNPLFNMLIPGAHDGKVSVESSKLAGMQAHLVMPVDHTFMMQNDKVIEQVKSFIAKGVFRPL